ncbi:CocE/NonD family hydrolase [soil metagenome]
METTSSTAGAPATPHGVRDIEHVWIPLEDGTRLAARIWLPEGATERPVPAILEYLPYRRRDGTRRRDDGMHPYVAGHGYACVRVDMRGSGDADGIIHDEYLPQEQADGLEVLRWLREQPWCNGTLGMIGISWGGFNGLQIAAHAPPGLEAIVTLCSTDDRYADDVHYMGGCLLVDNIAWASTMFAYNFRPPDPATFGDGWRETWMARLEGAGFWLEPWLEHQRRDAYWEQGSVCENPSGIRCAVFAVGGWADGYSNAIPRLLERLDVPRLGLIGPWGHRYPHIGVPGPAVGFLQEEIRWWDHWLKGIDTGIMAQPQLRAWMQDGAPPATAYEGRAGRWVGEPAWPSPNVEAREYMLSRGRIEPGGSVVAEERLTVASGLASGLDGGAWCSYGGPFDLPGDQRRDDGASLIFDTEPLPERIEILGAPELDVDVVSDRRVAMIAVRLSDVHPDGRVTRVTYGLCNLTHRDSHAHPAPLEPGRPYRVRVRLNDVGQAFEPGHRIRLAISTSYWPIAWPSPERTTLEVLTGASKLRLPVRPPCAEDERVGIAMPAVSAPPSPITVLEPASSSRTVVHDQTTGETVLEVVGDGGTFRFDAIDLEVTSRHRERYTSVADDPNSVRAETWWEFRYRRGPWNVATHTHTVLTSDTTHFRTHADVEAFEDDEIIFEKDYQRCIERDLV